MTLVSIYEGSGRIRCSLTRGELSVESEGTSFLYTLAKAYLKLMVRQIRARLVSKKLEPSD